MPFAQFRPVLTLPFLLIGLVATPVVLAQNRHPAERDQFLRTRACDRCNLSGEDFGRLDLKGVSLSEANLAGAMFYRSDLTNANLGGADLSQAVLTFANLSNANLRGANLSGANLTDAIAADLVAAITSDTTTCPDGQAGPCR